MEFGPECMSDFVKWSINSYTDRLEEAKSFSRVAVIDCAASSKQRQSVKQLEDGKTRLVNGEDDRSAPEWQSSNTHQRMHITSRQSNVHFLNAFKQC